VLKTKVTSAPILIFRDENKQYRVEVDASNYTHGGVLSQQGEDRKWHPMTFLSKSFNEVERNYDIYAKETLAIIRALEEWRPCLEGTRHAIEI